jgi:hypothetical protein
MIVVVQEQIMPGPASSTWHVDWLNEQADALEEQYSATPRLVQWSWDYTGMFLAAMPVPAEVVRPVEDGEATHVDSVEGSEVFIQATFEIHVTAADMARRAFSNDPGAADRLREAMGRDSSQFHPSVVQASQQARESEEVNVLTTCVNCGQPADGSVFCSACAIAADKPKTTNTCVQCGAPSAGRVCSDCAGAQVSDIR